MARSIKTKIIFITAAVMLTAMAAAIGMSAFLLSTAYEEALTSRSLAIATSLKLKLDRLFQYGITIDSLTGFDEQCRETVVSYQGISYAAVVDPDGRALFHSDPRKKDKPIVGADLREALEKRREEAITSVNEELQEFSAFIPVLTLSGEYVGGVVIGFPADLITGRVDALIAYAAGVSVLFLGMAIFFLFSFITFGVTRPLTRLVSVIGEVREGLDFSRRVHIDSDDEIGQLARSFNRMAETIQETTVSKKELERQRSFLQNVIDGVLDPIMVVGLDHQVLLMNHAAGRYLPEGEKSLIRCHEVFRHSHLPCRSPEGSCPLEEVRRTGEAVTVIHHHLADGGEDRAFELHASPFIDESGEILGSIQSARDITERLRVVDQLRENEINLKHLAYHDALTNLPNRLLFYEHLAKAMASARRSGLQVAVLLCDLDRFKIINDSFGHAAGDRVLQEIAARITSRLRESDVVARMGGDEFAIILTQIRDLNHIAAIATKLLSAMSQTVRVEEHDFQVTSSLGISLFPADAEDVQSLLKFSDTAMYGAKENGRNNFQFYTPDMNARTHEFLLLETDLRKGIEREQFQVHYQPQVDLRSGEVVGLEALVRWQHPVRAMVQPDDFIPLAEETGLIVPLGEWVLREACRQTRQWQSQGLPTVRMAVNISGRQFREPGFVAAVLRILEETGLEAKHLELEITESNVMENVEKAIRTLIELQQQGLTFSIDDFGTGYSSLAHLKRFPLSSLKIDRTFVREVIHSPNDAAIASSVIALGHSMGLKVVAEGVETREQLAFLEGNNCDLAQGYLFSPPRPAAEIEEILRERTGTLLFGDG